MTDTAIIAQFKQNPQVGYSALLDHYTPIILRMIRRFIADPDEVMETYTAICERLRHNNYQALKRFRKNSELTPWLSVVVANACRDRFRKNSFKSIPKSVLDRLNELEELVFKYYYQRRMQYQEISETIRSRHDIPCSVTDVGMAIARIDDLLSTSKRWHLLAALRANRPMLSLEDLSLSNASVVDRALLREVGSDGADASRVSALNRAVEALDESDQLLVLLRFEHGMRAMEIARVMQFDDHKYVYTRLRTIINRLRRRLKESLEPAEASA